MTPFLYKTKIINCHTKNGEGFLLIRGREDGSWSINLHHFDRNSAGCDTPEACYPAAIQLLAEWWAEMERRHHEGIAIIKSWPDNRPGYRPGWRERELKDCAYQHRRTAAAWVTVRDQIKSTMSNAGWATEIPE